ncbi:MAG: hypothetical protein R2809_14540 [Flavobacteriales bacterium]
MRETFCTDHWRCRFKRDASLTISTSEILLLLSKINDANFDIIKTEHLFSFDGKAAYSLGQGQ